MKGTSKFQPQCDPRVLGRTLLQIGHKRRQRLEWHIMGCMVDHPKVEAAPLQHKRWTLLQPCPSMLCEGLQALASSEKNLASVIHTLSSLLSGSSLKRLTARAQEPEP